MKFAIAGTGYVSLSDGILLAQHNEVVALDVVPEKVTMLNNKQSPIVDPEIEHFLQHKTLNFRATLNKEKTYENVEFVVNATPTDYEPETKLFNCHSSAIPKHQLQAITSQILKTA